MNPPLMFLEAMEARAQASAPGVISARLAWSLALSLLSLLTKHRVAANYKRAIGRANS